MPILLAKQPVMNTDLVRQSYNEWAAIYDSNENKTRDMDARVTQEVLGDQPYASVLELGCGTGKNTAWLAQQTSALLALDFSEEMLAVARQKVILPHVTFQQADLTAAWPAETAHYDLLCCNLVLEHLPNLQPFFDQAARACTTGGRLFISELHPYKHLVGGGARFEASEGTEWVSSIRHHVSDYTAAAHNAGFRLLQLNEWFDDPEAQTLPRLLTLLFTKD